jgi:hypothetical protein
VGKFDGWDMKAILRKKAERKRVLDERKKKRPPTSGAYTRMCDALFMPQFRGKPCERCYDLSGKVNMSGTVGHHIILKSQSLFLRWSKRNICVLCPADHFEAHNPSPKKVSEFMDWFKAYRPEDWEYLEANEHTKPAMKSRDYFENMKNMRKQSYC